MFNNSHSRRLQASWRWENYDDSRVVDAAPSSEVPPARARRTPGASADGDAPHEQSGVGKRTPIVTSSSQTRRHEAESLGDKDDAPTLTIVTGNFDFFLTASMSGCAVELPTITGGGGNGGDEIRDGEGAPSASGGAGQQVVHQEGAARREKESNGEQNRG